MFWNWQAPESQREPESEEALATNDKRIWKQPREEEPSEYELSEEESVT
jgi:hypothetical protein